MRITFLGKGGSGKTTLATSFIKYLEKKNKKVLAIDADINVNLGSALNMQKNYLGDIFDSVCSDLESNKNKPFIGSSPATRDSIFIKDGLNDPFIKKYGTFNNKGTALSFQNKPNRKGVSLAHIAYVHQLGSNGGFKAGHRYCFAKTDNNIAKRVCQELGGDEMDITPTKWTYYEIK